MQLYSYAPYICTITSEPPQDVIETENKIINDIAPVDNTMTIGDNVKITDWTKYKLF